MKYIEVKFNLEGDALDLLADMAADIGFEAFDGQVGYIQKQLWDEEALKAIIAEFPMSTPIIYSVREAEDKDWNAQWEAEGWPPNIIDGRLCIHDGRHLPDEPLPVMIEIDARQAFGTAGHQTTRLMLSKLLRLDLRGLALLDCGCGTGVLGIAALKLGAAQVAAYDIDEWSVDNARHNAVINMCDDSAFEVWQGDSSSIRGTYDIIVANIFLTVLLGDLPAYAAALRPDGLLLLSGFYAADSPALCEAAKPLGLLVEATHTDEDWAMIVMRHA